MPYDPISGSRYPVFQNKIMVSIFLGTEYQAEDENPKFPSVEAVYDSFFVPLMASYPE